MGIAEPAGEFILGELSDTGLEFFHPRWMNAGNEYKKEREDQAASSARLYLELLIEDAHRNYFVRA